MCHTAQRTKLFSSPAITLIGKRWNAFSLGIIPISGWKYFEKQKQMKIIIFLATRWHRRLSLSIFHTKQRWVRRFYVTLDKYLRAGLFHPAEPFQRTDETETAATGKELKCEQNTEMSAEYESVHKLFSEKVFSVAVRHQRKKKKSMTHLWKKESFYAIGLSEVCLLRLPRPLGFVSGFYTNCRAERKQQHPKSPLKKYRLHAWSRQFNIKGNICPILTVPASNTSRPVTFAQWLPVCEIWVALCTTQSQQAHSTCNKLQKLRRFWSQVVTFTSVHWSIYLFIDYNYDDIPKIAATRWRDLKCIAVPPRRIGLCIRWVLRSALFFFNLYFVPSGCHNICRY